MADAFQLALEAARSIRGSRGYAGLPAGERAALDQNLRKLEHALGRHDPYAFPLASPADFPPGLGGPANQSGASGRQASSNGAASSSASLPSNSSPPAPGTSVIGERARQALNAVDFTSFVSGLVTGTFRSIVDATSQQVREYADLVASLSHSAEDFTRDNVSLNQVRDHLAQRYPGDLRVEVPAAGHQGGPRLVPCSDREGSSPPWLKQYGLQGKELNEELTEGELLQAGRRQVGEQRLQTLATMVLMGINRIVINDGQIRAKLQFHAAASENSRAQLATQAQGQAIGIAARQVQMQSAAQTMVSTVNVNAQSDVAIKTNLVGEVSIRFSTETFPLERFADSPAIQLLQAHARWQPGNAGGPAAPANSATPAGSANTSSASTSPSLGTVSPGSTGSSDTSGNGALMGGSP